ncbi:T9SS type A sorting domain-containing protein [Hymenobacter ruricola]|uniref:T9SS type A sorting domain-containing protein n=1 Tax=Hymenobacter ruricola TaxID=2791023 RepID=UPI0021CE97C8|nr:T9SS type A sorting domain-containing protein [Hymenobacter ruricola]
MNPRNLFPNPAHHAATLRLPAGTAPAPLTLTDALGRAVRRYPVPVGPETALDLRGLPAGLYLLRGAGPARRLAVE